MAVSALLLLGGCVYSPYGYAAYPAYPAYPSYAYVAPPAVGVAIGGWGWRR